MIKVLQSGFYTSVQDLGRMDFQEYGVPVSGVMDQYSTKLANALVDNAEEAAVLELTMSGPKLEFEETALVSIVGADMSPKLNDVNIKLNSAFTVSKGDILSFGKLMFGFRAYLAVSGGFETQTVFDSKSMYQGITNSFRLAKNDVLEISNENTIERNSTNASIKLNASHFKDHKIEVFKGPEFEQLTKIQKRILTSQEFTIAKENSRMAYQLEETIENDLKPIITSLVLPGTVQLTPSGKLIVLMRDCQTSGGYPRVLQLNDLAISKLAQKFTGHSLCFKILE